MRNSFIDPSEGCNSTTQRLQSTMVEILHDRGIIYVYARDGTTLLKITGLPKPIPEIGDDHRCIRQLTIDIHEHCAVCDWGPTPNVVTASNVRPHPLEDDPWQADRKDAAYLLKLAGATLIDKGHDKD